MCLCEEKKSHSNHSREKLTRSDLTQGEKRSMANKGCSIINVDTEGSRLMRISLMRIPLLRFFKKIHKFALCQFMPYALSCFISLVQFFGYSCQRRRIHIPEDFGKFCLLIPRGMKYLIPHFPHSSRNSKSDSSYSS